jgi:undecaprenyl-diphosphatase
MNLDFSFYNELWLALAIGFTQGFSEFLPISSTAHMRLVSAFLLNGRDIGLTTSNFVQLGTLVAVMQLFSKDMEHTGQTTIQIFTKPKELSRFMFAGLNYLQGYGTKNLTHSEIRLWQMTIGTIPILVAGLLFRDLASSVRELSFIALFLVLGSILMAVADWYHWYKCQKLTDFTTKDALWVGLFQTLAILPGMSRSGATLSGALLLGKKRDESVHFSFLLSIPAIFITGLVDTFKLIISFSQNQISVLPSSTSWTANGVGLSWLGLGVAVASAYIVGYLYLKWLMKFLRTKSFLPFILYRLVLAGVLVWVGFR